MLRGATTTDHFQVHSSPGHDPAYTRSMDGKLSEIEKLTAFVRDNPRLVVLTGAGVSEASGIPTYRDREGRWRHSEPIKHQEFIAEPARRQRYWARSIRGWPAVRDARPNPAHQALTKLERAGYVQSIITQNVDRLHQRAGSRRVIDLHGRLDRVCCLECGGMHCRDSIQQRLEAINESINSDGHAMARPDGDVELPDARVKGIKIPGCSRCGGVLMPDVVFFGGTVPRERVATCMTDLENADALVAIGSSLQVYSGFRFCRRAADLGKPLAILNPGHTRADDMATLKLGTDCGWLLRQLAINLAHPSAGDSPS